MQRIKFGDIVKHTYAHKNKFFIVCDTYDGMAEIVTKKDQFRSLVSLKCLSLLHNTIISEEILNSPPNRDKLISSIKY